MSRHLLKVLVVILTAALLTGPIYAQQDEAEKITVAPSSPQF